MFKRILAFMLTVICMLSGFAGCGKNKEKNPLDTDAPPATFENTPVEVKPNTTNYEVPVPEELKYDISFDEYIILPDITSLKLNYHTMPTDDTAINNQIYNLQLQKAKRTEITDRPAAESDVVTVNYKSVFYGTEQQISDQKNVEISLGKHIAIPALEDAIIGMVKGETKTADIVYPENYAGNTILANSKATFTIELIKIETAELPELNEETIKSFQLGGVTTYEELRAYVLAWMEQENSLYKQDALYNTLVRDAQLTAMPQAEYNYYIDKFDANSTAAGASVGETLDGYIESNFESREAYEKKREEYAQDNVKKDLVIHCLKERYSVEVTKEEYNLALNVTFKSEAEGLGITTIDDFYNKMGESVYKMELNYQVIQAAAEDVPDKE